MIEAEVAQLPARQREAFLLRYWEELDVAETAAVHGLLGRQRQDALLPGRACLGKALKAKGIAP